MTIAEILLLDYDIEIANTRRTLERVPEDKPDYAPHEKSMKFGKLAMHCARMPNFGTYVIADPDMDMAKPRHPHLDFTFTTREAAIAALDESAAACRAQLAAATDEHMMELWKFSYGDMLISNASRAQTFRQLFFDHLIHHTAQLGVYLRMLDIPVPALYGPSADEQWSPK